MYGDTQMRQVNFKPFFLIISRGMSFWVWVYGTWVFVIPKHRSRKLRPLEVKKKRFKLVSILSPGTFYGHAMFIGGNSRKESRYLSSPGYRCRVWCVQNWLQFEQHYSDSVSSISSVKNSPANVIKMSAVILNPVSFSLFDRCDSDRPKKINILLLFGCCLWRLHDHKTVGDKNWEQFTKPFLENKFKGS